MKLICEEVENVQQIVEAKESGKKTFAIEGIFMQGDIKNRNGRMYPSEILRNEAARYTKELIETKRAYGELNHPASASINLDRASHLITSLIQEGSNFIGRAKILDTPMGMIVQKIMEAGGSFGVSTRGLGSLRENKQGIMEVQNDFRLATAADIVSDPSAPQAFVNGIMEGVEFWYEGGELRSREIAANNARNAVNNLAKHKKLDEKHLLKVFSNYLLEIV